MADDQAQRHEAIDDFITRWHEAPDGELNGPLAQEMGWTWKEYSAYVERNELPPKREGAL